MTNHETLDMKFSFKDRLIAATNLNDLVEVFANHHHDYKVIDPQFITASFLVQESPITNILKEPDLKLNLKYVEDWEKWRFELYQDQDLRHRKWFYENGQLKFQSWFLNGQIHRVNGPAFEEFDENGQLVHQEWHLDGRRLSKEKWLKRTGNNSSSNTKSTFGNLFRFLSKQP